VRRLLKWAGIVVAAFTVLFVLASVALLVLMPAPESNRHFTGKNYQVLASDPDSFEGATVWIAGEVFTAREVYDGETNFQMYADVEGAEFNTLVRKSGTTKAHIDDYVLVRGEVNGAYEGENAMGRTISAVDIQAKSIQRISRSQAQRLDADA